MAHLHKKVKKDLTYYYIRESQRIKGRPTIVNQVCLGTADNVRSLFEVREGNLPEGFSPKEYGSVFLIHALDLKIDLVGIIDEILPPGKKIRGPSLGEIIFYAAMNRAIAPTSKRKLAAWFEQTDIQRIRPVRLISLSSQNFWNHWDRIRTAELEKIKNRFFKKVIASVSVEENAHLLMETGLLFPSAGQNAFIGRSPVSSVRFNKTPKRQVKIALLTNRRGIPLYYQTIDEGEPVIKHFGPMVDNLLAKVSFLGTSFQDLTVLIGANLNAAPLCEKIADKDHVRFIAVVSPDAYPELLSVSTRAYQVLPCKHNRRLRSQGEEHLSILYFGPSRAEKEQAFILFDPALYRKMRRELRDRLQKLRQDLIIWQRELRSQPLESFIREIKGRFVSRCKDLSLDFEVMKLTFGREDGRSFVQSQLNRRQCAAMLQKMGKMVVRTDRLDWQAQEVCGLAVGRGLLGESFNRPQTLFQSALTPQYHWTESKIPIHVFVCMAALTYQGILDSRLDKAGLLLNAKEAIEEMRSLRTAIFLLSEEAKPERLFEKPSELHVQIARALGYEIRGGKIEPLEG
ncbi:IS1634 family transposase [Desulfobacca acetoxidans]